jgi:hypothetical protein
MGTGRFSSGREGTGAPNQLDFPRLFLNASNEDIALFNITG